eukprot:497116-Lingulodinium_polyedra.AAC.1
MAVGENLEPVRDELIVLTGEGQVAKEVFEPSLLQLLGSLLQGTMAHQVEKLMMEDSILTMAKRDTVLAALYH